jgi:biopolymer transport protein TolR
MKAGSTDDLNSEINVTPMVDVMLVLLIIFMITAPMMNTGVDLELPQLNAQNIEDPEGPLILDVIPEPPDKPLRYKLKLGETFIPWADLEAKLKTNAKVQREGKLYVGAAKNIPYGVVLTAMNIARNAKVQKVMMLTDPTQTLPLQELDQNIGAPAASH